MMIELTEDHLLTLWGDGQSLRMGLRATSNEPTQDSQTSSERRDLELTSHVDFILKRSENILTPSASHSSSVSCTRLAIACFILPWTNRLGSLSVEILRASDTRAYCIDAYTFSVGSEGHFFLEDSRLVTIL